MNKSCNKHLLELLDTRSNIDHGNGRFLWEEEETDGCYNQDKWWDGNRELLAVKVTMDCGSGLIL